MVIPVRRSVPPLERSPGTRPRKAMNRLAESKRSMPCTSETAQPPRGLAVGLARRNLNELLVEHAEPLFEQLDSHQVLCKDEVVASMLPFERAQPGAVPCRPRPPIAVDQSSSQQHLAQPMPAAQKIVFHVLTTADEVSHRFLLQRRRLDDRERSAAPIVGEFPGVPAIRLDSLSRLAGHERRRHHGTSHTLLY